MLFIRTRKATAVFALVAMIVGSATPALAFKDEGMRAREKSVPIVIDALLLRPAGLMMTAGGAVLAIIPTAIVAITRPTDIVKPLDALVALPFRYTFMDPLGEHSPVTLD